MSVIGRSSPAQLIGIRASQERLKAFAPDPICDADQLAPVGQTGKSEKRPRAVLLIVTQWPSGTMAMKFGSAMKSALRVAGEEMILVQMEPERIFRPVMM
jgi:hypothetical protein